MGKWTVALALALLAAAAHAGEYTLAVGAEFGRGDYGTGATATFFELPVGLGYADEEKAWSLSVPYRYLHSREDLVPSGTGLRRRQEPGGQEPRTHTVSGLGDVTASGSLRLLAEGERTPRLGVTGKVKFGTAGRDLGTGEDDYSLQLEAAKGPLGAMAGYRWLGDPAETAYRDVAFAAVSVGWPLGERADWAVEYFWEDAPLAGDPDRREASLLFGLGLGPTRRIDAFLTRGLSDASPDFVLGIGLRHTL